MIDTEATLKFKTEDNRSQIFIETDDGDILESIVGAWESKGYAISQLTYTDQLNTAVMWKDI